MRERLKKIDLIKEVALLSAISLGLGLLDANKLHWFSSDTEFFLIIGGILGLLFALKADFPKLGLSGTHWGGIRHKQRQKEQEDDEVCGMFML